MVYTSSYTEASIIFREIEFLLAYFVKLVGFFSLCLFFGMLVKRSAFALGFLVITWFLEGIIYLLMVWKIDGDLPDKIFNFFPIQSMYKLIDQPIQRIIMTKFPAKTDMVYDYAVHWYEIAIVLGWTALFIFLSYRLLKKRDL